ncbi:MAG TPA: hypothetical protein VHX99_07110 [Rhizomicrobium sp.]|nr:hypothetical protein [Rhizomicrobium sp.]
MQNDSISELLAQDHARLSARLAGRRPMRDIVLARLDHRNRFRDLVLSGAAILGAAIALAELMALELKGPLSPVSPSGLGFVLAFLVIAGTIGALGQAMAD